MEMKMDVSDGASRSREPDLAMMELNCLETQKKCQVGEDGKGVVLGRGREWEITDVRVGRSHAEVRWVDGKIVEIVNDRKPIFIRRRTGKRIVQKEAGSRSRLNHGDVVFLLRVADALMFGFELRRSRLVPPPPSPEIKESALFSGEKFVFLTKSHVVQLRKRLVLNGGEVVEGIGKETDFAIVSENTKEMFRNLFELEPHVRFVKREFISDSLTAGRRMDPKHYLVYTDEPSIPKHTSKIYPWHPSTYLTSNVVEGTGSGVYGGLPTDYDWIEEYDEDKATDTVNKLFRHWTHYRTASDAMDFSEDSENDSDVDGGESTSLRNCVCSHAACAALDVCFIQHLTLVKSHYHGGKADPFKIKAIDKAIRVLEALNVPLKTDRHIENLKLGKKTADKLIQILNTGHVQRNEELEDDEQEHLFQMFTTMWGAGKTTAQKWIGAGCSSLSDVLKRTDLTAIQRVGLQYYDDFQKKIPRSEVVQIYDKIKTCVAHVIAHMMRSTVRRCQSQVFCAVLGSFVRGNQEMGDIDIMIAPPESCSDLMASDILQEVLNELLRNGIITSDLDPDKLKRKKEAAASWMGVCCSPTVETRHRIDIKVYDRASLPFALNYFIGSQDFVRALRYWCNTPTEETAQLAEKQCPGANAFHLSDHALQPVARSTSRKARKLNTEPLGPSVCCTTETDIFAAVGLHYVPPWMRKF